MQKEDIKNSSKIKLYLYVMLFGGMTASYLKETGIAIPIFHWKFWVIIIVTIILVDIIDWIIKKTIRT